MLYVKALHIIFVVTWFAGLFYMVRLFIYITEAHQKPENEQKILLPQLNLMAKRLWYIITWPSAILTLVFGPTLLYLTYGFFIPTWLIIKLVLVFILFIYHLISHRVFLKLQAGQLSMTSTQLRLWNELATLLLVAIVFLAVIKSTLDMIWGLAGFILLGMLLMLAVKLYKNLRSK